MILAAFVLYFLSGRGGERRRPRSHYPEDAEIGAIFGLIRLKLATQDDLKRHTYLEACRTERRLNENPAQVSEDEWQSYHRYAYERNKRTDTFYPLTKDENPAFLE